MRIVVKVGTSTLTHATGRMDIRHVETLCKVLSDIKNAGHEVVLVSSGAIGMGVGKLNLTQRKFSLLCGHDTNLAAVMGALEVRETNLPEAIEQEAPISSKLVVEKWQGKAGESFVALKLVYPSTSQLCGKMPIDTSHPPQALPLRLHDMEPNQDGLISMHDFQQRIAKAIANDEDLMDR